MRDAIALDSSVVVTFADNSVPVGDKQRRVNLDIIEKSGYDDGGFSPAQHVSISHLGVIALRDWLNKMLPPVVEESK